jgi:TRAP-type mannitol/chloroaromatic compound transport system permease small subunit
MLKRFCDGVDRLNEWVGAFWGLTVIGVTFAVVYEVVARSAFGSPTLWSNETTIYLSAMTYLIAGGYALRHRRHVRIDVIYERRSRRTKLRLDLLTFVFFLGYAGTLVWVGGEMAWQSFLQRETTATPWNPPVWPVKATIPLAGLLLLLQGVANMLRDLGMAPSAERQ